MRNVTLREQAILESRTYATHVRVRVRRPDGTDVDLGQFLGQDWLMGVQWAESTDTPVAQATVAVRRSGPGGTLQSLSPLVANSLANQDAAGEFVPLLKVGRQFRVDVASVPGGEAPAPGEWKEMFFGRIDNLDAGPEELRFDGRDYAGGLLQDTFIEAEANYGNDVTGIAVQSVMQQIATAAGLPSAFVSSLWVPLDPMWQLGRYTQKRVPVYEAWQQLAQQLGWEVRQQYRLGHGFVPTLRSPERIFASEAWTFGPDDYLELPVVRTSSADIRNVVEVVYSNYTNRDVTNQPKREAVVSINPSSIAEYGRRYMQVAEGSTSNINTETEARRLADVAIADLSDSALEVEVRLGKVFWPVEVTDLIKLEPDGVALDSTQLLAVVSIDHAFTSDGLERTTLKLRGRPSISRREWMLRDAAPGIAKVALTTGPDAPGSLSVTNTVAGAVVSFAPAPSGPAWAAYELHVSTTPAFTPSSDTFKVAQPTTRFEVTGLPPGVPHYARVVPRTATGAVGTASAQVTLTPRYVAPGLLQPRVSFRTTPVNGDWEAVSVAGQPPDAWTDNLGNYGSAVTLVSDSYAGANALRFTAGAMASLSSQAFTVRGGEVWVVSAYAKQSSSGVLAGNLVLEFLNAGLGAVGTYTVPMGDTATVANSWRRYYGATTVPATARYALVTVSRLASHPGSLTVDSVNADAIQSYEAWRAILPSTDTSGGTKYGAGFANESEAVYGLSAVRRDDLGNVEFRGSAATMAAVTNATLITLQPEYRPNRTVKFYVCSSAGILTVTVVATGVVQLVGSVASGVAFSLAPLRYTLT